MALPASAASAWVVRIRRAGPPAQSAVDGDLYAIHWEADGIHHVAEVGRPIDDESRGPVRFIFRGDPYVVVPIDQPAGVRVPARQLQNAVEFVSPPPPPARRAPIPST